MCLSQRVKTMHAINTLSQFSTNVKAGQNICLVNNASQIKQTENTIHNYGI